MTTKWKRIPWNSPSFGGGLWRAIRHRPSCAVSAGTAASSGRCSVRRTKTPGNSASSSGDRRPGSLRARTVRTRHGTGSLGHRVNRSSFTSGSPGHHFDPVWHPTFSVFEKMPKMQNVHLKCWNDESHCQVSVVGLKSLDASPCNELLLWPMIIKNSLAWKYFFTHKSTFGVHCRTGSPGQLGLRVAGFPGHWVAGSILWPSSISGANACQTQRLPYTSKTNDYFVSWISQKVYVVHCVPVKTSTFYFMNNSVKIKRHEWFLVQRILNKFHVCDI